MPLSTEQLITILIAQLDPLELNQGVAYVTDDPFAAGSTLAFPRVSISVPWNALLAFIDRDPLANWGHACRYLLINRNSGETISVDAQFPPFRRNDERRWRVAYKAPSVPDTALAPLP